MSAFTQGVDDHRATAQALVDEFNAVGIRAEIGAYTGDPAGSSSTALIHVEHEGTEIARLSITASDGTVSWKVPGRDHGHEMLAGTPAAQVTEVVALCFAGRCTDITRVLDQKLQSLENTTGEGA
ncbi:hypothetical protein [Brevibacterium oceani]|uniref:hypothetical protein n=1 Tax=Brevibacterium oceani TaxID=358099 RepID=UPI0015E7396B|nr:hypothetical protein [Brevibacterium oceani]